MVWTRAGGEDPGIAWLREAVRGAAAERGD